jgi:hypothetical protein
LLGLSYVTFNGIPTRFCLRRDNNKRTDLMGSEGGFKLVASQSKVWCGLPVAGGHHSKKFAASWERVYLMA